MNSIRDLWETVVLRDVLGYIVPGAVTLLALALLVLPLAGRAPRLLIAGMLHPLMSRKPWICSYPWLVVAIVIPLCFVIGHIQGQLVAFLAGRHCFRRWNPRDLALDSLKEEMKRGGEYVNAALREVAGTEGAVNLVARCAEKPGRFRELCCCLNQVGSNTEKDDSVQQAQCGQEAKEQARDLWYLCNHYVLSESPSLHAMWIGRYYVLAILFSNLFVSFVLLSLAVGFLPLLGCLGSCLMNAGPHITTLALDPIRILQVFGLLAAALFWIYLLWVCSCQFHQAYVERTFPIFYLLSRPKGMERPDNES